MNGFVRRNIIMSIGISIAISLASMAVVAQTATETPTATPTFTVTPTTTPTPLPPTATPTPLPAMELSVSAADGESLDYNWGDSFFLNYTIRPANNDLIDFTSRRVDIYIYLYLPDGSYYPFTSYVTLTSNTYYSDPTFSDLSFDSTTCGKLKFEVGAAPLTGDYKFAALLTCHSPNAGTYESNSFVLNKPDGPTPTPTPTATPVPDWGLNLYFLEGSVLPGNQARLYYTIVPSQDVGPVDIYLSIVTPYDVRYFLNENLSIGQEILPIASGKQISQETSGILGIIVPASAPEWLYRIQGAIVRTGANVMDSKNMLYPGIVQDWIYIGHTNELDPIASTLSYEGHTFVLCQ